MIPQKRRDELLGRFVDAKVQACADRVAQRVQADTRVQAAVAMAGDDLFYGVDGAQAGYVAEGCVLVGGGSGYGVGSVCHEDGGLDDVFG